MNNHSDEINLLEGNENLVCLTQHAAEKISELISRENKGDFLRIRITGGGCNGLSYKMKFVSNGRMAISLSIVVGFPS